MVNLILFSFYIFANIFSLPFQGDAIPSCSGACSTLNDCTGQLICIDGKCTDDLDVGTHICSGGGVPLAPLGDCRQSGTLVCGGKSHPTYRCSPQVLSSTPVKLTVNDFSEGGDGGGQLECDDKYHSNEKPVVALSTEWYNGGSRCGQMIMIKASNGRRVAAKVVDECDSMHGCDKDHTGQTPCRNNIMDGSEAVWKALGLHEDEDLGEVDVTWSAA